MHPGKNIKKLSELNDFFKSSEKVSDTLVDILKLFDFGPIRAMLNSLKKRGYPGGDLMAILLLLPFGNVNSVRALFFSGLSLLSPAQKDAYYRLKNRENVDWRRMLRLFTRRFQHLAHRHGSREGTRCLIVDDSLLKKTGQFAEGVSKVYDHVTQRYLWGFKLLTLGWWDGKSFIPVDFSIHREKGKNKKMPFGLKNSHLKKQYKKKRQKDTPGYQRKKEIDTSKINQAINMLCRAVRMGLDTDYVLTDSWFFCHELLKKVRKLKKGSVHLIAMCKMGKINFEYQGQMYSPHQLKQRIKHKQKRCKKLRAHYINCQAHYHGIPINLFFVRYAGHKNYKLMVTSDMKLNFITMMEYYSIRWSIEVFFKEAKQHLKLGRSQSQDLDAQIADITLTMIQYMLLNLSKRFNSYETIGRLFDVHSKEMTELTIADRIWGLLAELMRQICEVLEIDPDHLLEKLLNMDDQHPRLVKLLWQMIEPDPESVLKKVA